MKNFKSLLSKTKTPSALKPAELRGALKPGLLLAVFITAALPFKLSAQAPTIHYSSPHTYTLGVAISSLAPTSSGVGVAGSYNSTPVVVGSGFNSPTSVAIDASGRIYVADFNNNAIKKIPANGGAPVVIGSGFDFAYGVATDAAGDVYVADTYNNAVKEIPAGGGKIVTLGSGFKQPIGVAADAAGNVYVADFGNAAVKEIPAGGGDPVTLGYGFSNVRGVAVDGAGNVYVADTYNNAVKEIPAGRDTTLVLGSGFSFPYGVAVDATGNVFVADEGNNAIKMIPVGGGSPIAIGGSGFDGPQGIAVDAVGNVYVADADNNAVKKIIPSGGYFINPVLPAGLSFDPAGGVISGTPKAAITSTKYTVTAYNLSGAGTANVYITVVKPVLNITANSGVGISGLSVPPLTLTYTGFINGDTPASLDTLPKVSTTATKSSPAGKYLITVDSAASANYTITYTQGIVYMEPSSYVSYMIPAKTYGDADFSEFGQAGPGLTYSSTNPAVATIIDGKIHITGAGTSTINVSNGSNSLNKTLTVNPATLTITANDRTVAEGAIIPGLTVTYSGFVNGETPAVLTTKPKATTTATKKSPPGNYTINVSGAAAANYTFVYVTGTLTITEGDISSPLAYAPRVNAAVSPNGDGRNEVLTIANIEKYPDNKVTLMSSNGAKIFELSGYDNVNKAFNGRSNISGKMVQPGTYFYKLQYQDNGEIKSVTGYILLKY